MIEESQLIDLLDTHTRVTKTNYRLGWPSRQVTACVVVVLQLHPRHR
jgi:hypothetical protein